MTKEQSRRTFLGTLAIVSAGATHAGKSNMEKPGKKQLIHQLFFWLKNRDSKEDLAQLIKGLRGLEQIETIQRLHIGVPASTKKRDVVDASYSVSELMFFDDAAGQKAYQDHPVHKQLIEACSHLWEKVVVYDSMDV